jgi:hypothetical protein
VKTLIFRNLYLGRFQLQSNAGHNGSQHAFRPHKATNSRDRLVAASTTRWIFGLSVPMEPRSSAFITTTLTPVSLCGT